MQASLRSSDYQQHHHHHHQQHHQQQQHQHESQQQYYGYAANVTVGPAPIDCVASLLRQHHQHHQHLPQDYFDPSQELSELAAGVPEAVNDATVLQHLHAPCSVNQQSESLEGEADLTTQQQQHSFRANDYGRYSAFGHGEHHHHHHHHQQQQHPADDIDDNRIVCCNHERQHQDHDHYQLADVSVQGDQDSLSTVILEGAGPSGREQQQQEQLDYRYHQNDQSVYCELAAAASCNQEQLSSEKPNVVGINLNLNEKQHLKIIERQEVIHQHLYDATTVITTAAAAPQQVPAAEVQLHLVSDEYQHQQQQHHRHHHHRAETSYHKHQSMMTTIATATTTSTTITDLSGAYLNCDKQTVASSLDIVQPADQVQLPSHLYQFNYSGAKAFPGVSQYQDNIHSYNHSLNRLGQFNEQIIDGHQANAALHTENPDTVQQEHLRGTHDSPAFNHDYHLNHQYHPRIDYRQAEADLMINHDSGRVQECRADDGPSGLQNVTASDRFQQHYHHAPTVNNSTGSNSLRNSYSSAISTSSSSSTTSSTNSSSASIGSDVDSVDSTMPRDEKKAKEANIPLSYNEIVNLSIEQFNEHIARFHFTEAQLTLMRDIRRRGKNKVAAQTCRRRKMEQITELQHELNHLSNKRLSLSCERSRLTQEHCRLTKDYEKLYSIIQSYMN